MVKEIDVEPTAAMVERGTADTEALFERVNDAQLTETQGDPLRAFDPGADAPLTPTGEAERESRIAQAHAQFLATVCRTLLDRLYGAKVAAGELPAELLMQRIQGELDVINNSLRTLTENGGAGGSAFMGTASAGA